MQEGLITMRSAGIWGNMPFAVWITGLPGSGKSTIAKNLASVLKKKRIDVKYLNLDMLRKTIAAGPKYTDRERDFTYKKFADIGFGSYNKGRNVLFDATAHKQKYRDYARKQMQNFYEVYIKCPLEICMERETKRKQGLVKAQIYTKALRRLMSGKREKGLGEVVGIDVQYEIPKNAEMTIDSEKTSPKQAAEKIIRMVLPNAR